MCSMQQCAPAFSQWFKLLMQLAMLSKQKVHR